MSDLRRKLRESHLAGHAYILLQRLIQGKAAGRRAIFFFPDQMYTGTAGDLRACAIARELRSMGWITFIVPPWLDLKARQAIIQREPSAVLFFQQSRHELNRPRFYPSRICVFDADDADILVAPERVIECLSTSSGVIAGSHFLADQFRPHNSNVAVIWTGTYVTDIRRRRAKRDIPVIAWAQSDPFSYPEEARLVRDVWIALASEGVRFAIVVYSRQLDKVEEWLGPVRRLGVEILVRPLMRYRAFVESLSDVDIGFQPVCPSFPFSRGKSFGKLLAYMAARVPAIASDELDHGIFFRNGKNGLLVKTIDDWLSASKRLIESQLDREMLAEAAHADLLTRLTSRRSAELVSEVCARCLPGWISEPNSGSG